MTPRGLLSLPSPWQPPFYFYLYEWDDSRYFVYVESYTVESYIHNIMSSRFIHTVARDRNFFLYKAQ